MYDYNHYRKCHGWVGEAAYVWSIKGLAGEPIFDACCLFSNNIHAMDTLKNSILCGSNTELRKLDNHWFIGDNNIMWTTLSLKSIATCLSVVTRPIIELLDCGC